MNTLKMFVRCFAYLSKHPTFILLGILLFFINISILVLVAAKVMLFACTIYLIVPAYLLISFLVIYYEAILTAVTIKQLNDKQASVFMEIYHSKRYLFSVLLWSIVLNTIGLVIKIIHICWLTLTMRYFYISLGYASSPRDASWTLSTYFVLPMLVAENINLKTALKQSNSLYGSGWQKNFDISSLVGIVAVIIITIYYCMFTRNWQFDNLLAVFIMIVFFTMIVVTLEAIVKGALYTGCVLHKWLPQSQFNQGLINSAFTRVDTRD